MSSTSYIDKVTRHLSARWASLPDHRKPNNNQQYKIADGVRSAYAVFFMHEMHLHFMQPDSFPRTCYAVGQVWRISVRCTKNAAGAISGPCSRPNRSPATRTSATCSTPCRPNISSLILIGCWARCSNLANSMNFVITPAPCESP